VSRILLRGGRLLDPASGRDERGDLLIEGETISACGPGLAAAGAQVIDVSGCWVAPGFVDLHCHLREPGQEYKEDIASGGRAAVAGGFTQIACMANTHPVNDDPAMTDYILDRARHDSPARVLPIAAATRGLEGKVMTEMSALVAAGAVAFSDDGKTIMDSGVMRRVLQYSRLVEAPVIVHCEDRTLVADGVVNEGPVSTRLGLPGNPAVAEEVQIARDLLLAAATGAHLHVAHVSTAGGVAMIRRARERGINVSAEVTPHHLTLTDAAALGFDTNTKVAPPLRSEADRKACREGLADGTLDAIATDHTPVSLAEWDCPFTEARAGFIGLELAFAALLELVASDRVPLARLVHAFSAGPARVIGLSPPRIEVDAVAELVLVDPNRRWRPRDARLASKSRNSPLLERELEGHVDLTIVAGRLAHDALA
jgi:dihydroorotase